MPTNLPTNLATIIHIGAGKCAEFDTYLATAAQNIILVEPLPDLAAELKRKAKHEPRVRVVEAAVQEVGAFRQLHQFNLVEASSLYQPTELFKLYPGLKTVKEHPVEVCSLQSLLEQDFISSELANVLIIDAPGAELVIANSLNEIPQAKALNFIQLACAEDSLYESAGTAQEVLQVLIAQGYELRAKDDSDPDRPVWNLERNMLTMELNALRSELAKAHGEIKKQEEINADFQFKSDKLAERLKSTASELEKSYKKNLALKNRVKVLEGEKADIKRQSREANKRFKKEVGLLSKKHEDADRNQQEKKRVVSEKNSLIEELRRKLDSNADDFRRKEEAYLRELELFGKREASLREKIEKLAKENENLISAQALNFKLLTKLEIDNDSLREKYSRKVDSERELQDLIKELHGKLQLAANFYNKLQIEHPDLISQY